MRFKSTVQTQGYFIWFLTFGLVLAALFAGKKLLIPFVLAVFIWYLINALQAVYAKIPIGKWKIPGPLCLIMAIITIFGVLSFFIQLITDNIADLVELAPVYQKNLEGIIYKLFNGLPFDEPPTIRQFLSDLKIGAILSQFAKTMTGMAGNTGIVVIYLIFLFLEQKTFRHKLDALLRNFGKRKEVFDILQKIDVDIKLYIGVKTFTSASTALLSYIIMAIVGLDFAAIWAIMIFVFNYIPTIGSIVATLFPATLALIQFESIYPFVVVTGGLTALQFAIGNVLDPKLLGNTLNLSPLFIILSLSLWGTIWGVAGMILCVPIMVILMIVLSYFPKARFISILLSKDGNVAGKIRGPGAGSDFQDAV